MELAEFTRQLGQVYARGDRYGVIEQGHRALAEVPHAPELVALVLRALVDVGLGGPARELLQLRRDLDGVPGGDGLQSAVATLGHGRVRWNDRAEVFRKNAAALCGHRPELRAAVESARGLLAGIQLYRGTDGGYHISRRDPGRLREWLADLTGPLEDRQLTLPPPQRIGAVAIVGLRASPLFERAFDGTFEVFLTHSKPVFLIEPAPARFLAALHCWDFTKPLGDERVQVFVGPDAPEQIEIRLTQGANIPLPNTIINCCADPRIGEQLTAALERVTQTRANELARLEEQIERRYRGRDAAYWSERFAPPERVLGFTSRFTTMLQYSARDTLRAFEELGYATHLLIETKDHELLSPIEMCKAILDLDPVAILMLDHLRHEMPHVPANVPLLTWIQDPLPNLLCGEAGAAIGPLDFVCGYYYDQCTEKHGYPPDQFEPADMPVSTRVFHDGKPDAESERHFSCDVSFVSNASTPIDRLFESMRQQHVSADWPLLTAIYDRIRCVLAEGAYLSFHETAADLVRTVAANVGVELPDEQVEFLKTSFAFRLFDWGRRHQTLEWVGDWARRTGRSFKIYGRGWEAHPTLAEFAAGFLEHGEPLRCANHGSTLGLQLIPTGFRHQRSYELLTCGTLPLTRHCESDFNGLEIEEFQRRKSAGEEFRSAAGIFPGLERIVFSTPEEFAVLAERFLGDDEYRRTVHGELAAVVSRNYTYTAVVRKVADAFRGHVAREAAKQLSTVG